MAMKYIIINGPYYDIPFLFDDATDHSEFAHMVTYGQMDKVLSAGFVEIYDGKVRCYGHSTSLKMQSQADDTKLVARFLAER